MHYYNSWCSLLCSLLYFSLYFLFGHYLLLSLPLSPFLSTTLSLYLRFSLSLCLFHPLSLSLPLLLSISLYLFIYLFIYLFSLRYSGLCTQLRISERGNIMRKVCPSGWMIKLCLDLTWGACKRKTSIWYYCSAIQRSIHGPKAWKSHITLLSLDLLETLRI